MVISSMEVATQESQDVVSQGVDFPSPFGRLRGEVPVALVPAHIFTVTNTAGLAMGAGLEDQ